MNNISIVIKLLENKRIEKDITKYKLNKKIFGIKNNSRYHQITYGNYNDIKLSTLLNILKALEYKFEDFAKDFETELKKE